MNRKKEHSARTNNDFQALANCSAFLLFLVAGGMLSLFLPKMEISEKEKRALTPLPHLSVINLFAGDYTDSLDLHYADNFPFRDDFVEFTGIIKETFGYRNNDVRIYTTVETPVEKPIAADSSVVMKADTVVVPKRNEKGKENKEVVNSILIHNGMAFQLFRGSADRAIAFAEMINAYRRAIDDSINMYCLIAPSAIDYYLPLSMKSTNNLEKPNIDVVYSHLDSGVYGVDAYSEIQERTNEYVYFNTDHHWTVRGAYYAYRAWCKNAGLTPAELSSFRRRVRKGYLGSLYHLTNDVRLKANRDSVESFLPPGQTVTYRYPTSDLQNPVLAKLLAGSANYATFLGGDFPLVRIETDLHNARRILVIKDSFGNALCPFLTMHYEEVFVVDYRYFEKNLLTFIRNNRITDVMFLHNTFVTNTEFTVKKEKFLMRVRDKTPQTVIADTVATELRIQSEVKGDSTR